METLGFFGLRCTVKGALFDGLYTIVNWKSFVLSSVKEDFTLHQLRRGLRNNETMSIELVSLIEEHQAESGILKSEAIFVT